MYDVCHYGKKGEEANTRWSYLHTASLSQVVATFTSEERYRCVRSRTEEELLITLQVVLTSKLPQGFKLEIPTAP